MHLTKHRIQIGLEKPFRILHISDSHLTLADERDGDWKMKIAADRTRWARNAMEHFKEQLAYARKQNLTVIHTGDLSDFVSLMNLETAQQMLDGIPYFLTPGNHEFMRFVDANEFLATSAYKTLSYDKVQGYYKNNLTIDNRLMGGINFVAIDNGFYEYSEEQLIRLKAEVQKGYPIVLMMHIPLYTPAYGAFMLHDCKSRTTALLGTPREILDTYNAYDRFEQSWGSETENMIQYILSEPMIRCILCGHTHREYQDVLPSGIVQYSVGAGMDGYAEEIEFY